MRVLFLILLVLSGHGASAEISGKARFSDADTLSVSGVTVRLFGIDAPELDQTCHGADGSEWDCGKWAADQARTLFQGKILTCQTQETDRYGRSVAICFADGADIAKALVRNGIATAYRDYSTRYVSAEKEAALAFIGIWQGTLEPPADYRAAKVAIHGKLNAESAPEGCLIKGNISERGRIYHLPGQEGYDRTLINEAKGEHWFCSEAEARAAGWRRAGG